jgi:uncharacterized protein YbaR (Trm112 family)
MIKNKNYTEIICPISFDELIYNDLLLELWCSKCLLAYPIINNIPIMLSTKARKLDNKDVDDLINKRSTK